jgi:hypothetical protein
MTSTLTCRSRCPLAALWRARRTVRGRRARSTLENEAPGANPRRDRPNFRRDRLSHRVGSEAASRKNLGWMRLFHRQMGRAIASRVEFAATIRRRACSSPSTQRSSAAILLLPARLVERGFKVPAFMACRCRASRAPRDLFDDGIIWGSDAQGLPPSESCQCRGLGPREPAIEPRHCRAALVDRVAVRAAANGSCIDEMPAFEGAARQ